MKFTPRYAHIIGRMVIQKDASLIVRDQTKVSKFVIVDAVGDGVNGIKPGDMVLPVMLGNIILNDGFRPYLEEKNIAFLVTDVSLSDLLIQTHNGSKYVPFDSPEAAYPMGAQDEPSEVAA